LANLFKGFVQMNRLERHFLGVVAFAVGALFLCAGTARAQGSRKDDIVLNAQGRPMAGAAVRVCTSAATGQPCSPLASLFSDAGLTQALANPISTDGLGNYSFYASPGRYEIELSGPGITTKQLPNVILPSDPTSPTFTSVTTTSGISAFSLSLSGNLTVSGSTAVTGALTVGGSPVPTTAQENQWTASQHFKGPNPWRDFTAYMKDSNGNPVNCSSTTPVNGADTTGTISLSTPTTVTLAAARDFKNGCGAMFAGAGPLSTLPAPPVSPTVTSATASSNAVTLTFSGSPFFAGGFFGILASEAVAVSSCSNANYNGIYIVVNIPNANSIQYQTPAAGTGSATGCVANFVQSYVHGATGSTTYKYQLVQCDFNEGCSAGSSTITVTGAVSQAGLSKNNYNWISYLFNTNAAIYLLYSDKGLGGALTCVNASVSMAIIDIGGYNPCPPYAPTNPPASATAQALSTTIVSGAGTTTLTIANAASTAVTNANVYHDESSFLNSCITDVNNNQPLTGVGGAEYGCYVPAGVYGINGPLKTATLNPNGNLNIYVAGLLNFQTQPWQILNGNYQILGVGGGAQGGTVGQHKASTRIAFGPNVPYGFVLGTASYSSTVKGFQMQYVNGTGVFIGSTNPSNGTSGVSVEDMNIVEQGATGNAPCVTIDDDNIGIWLTNISCQANQAVGGMPCVYITHTPFDSLVNQILRNVDVNCEWHAWKIDGPGGNGSQAVVHDVNWYGSFGENLPNADLGEIQLDNQGAPGEVSGWGLQGISLDHVLMSDSSLSGTFAQMNATNMPISAVEVKNSYLSANPVACAIPTSCPLNTIGNVMSSGVGFQTMNTGTTGLFTGVGSTGPQGQPNLMGGQLGIVPPSADFGNSPANDIPFAVYMIPPVNNVSSTGAGSLAAGVYCNEFTGLDSTPQANETNASVVRCQTVGASSSIVYDIGANGGIPSTSYYAGYNFYYCGPVGAGTTCGPNQKFSNVSTSSDGGSGRLFTFSSTTGSTSATPPANSAAMLSWVGNDPTTPFSCFFCAASSSDSWPVGFGVNPTANVGINLFTKLGIKVGATTFSTLASCSSSLEGAFRAVTDSTTSTWGAAITGGGSNHVLAYCDGSNWTVMAK
jgi:hypothetical protein